MRFFFCILILIASSCGKTQKTQVKNIYKRDPQWQLASEIYNNEVRQKLLLELRNEKKLHMCASGWALLGKDKIQQMHCSFYCYKEIDLEEARRLLVTAGNVYLRSINENERIRSYLGVYPFKPENLEVVIFIQNQDGSKFSPEKPYIISMSEGKLRYRTGMKDPNNYLTEICEETYDEAMAKL